MMSLEQRIKQRLVVLASVVGAACSEFVLPRVESSEFIDGYSSAADYSLAADYSSVDKDVLRLADASRGIDVGAGKETDREVGYASCPQYTCEGFAKMLILVCYQNCCAKSSPKSCYEVYEGVVKDCQSSWFVEYLACVTAQCTMMQKAVEYCNGEFKIR